MEKTRQPPNAAQIDGAAARTCAQAPSARYSRDLAPTCEEIRRPSRADPPFASRPHVRHSTGGIRRLHVAPLCERVCGARAHVLTSIARRRSERPRPPDVPFDQCRSKPAVARPLGVGSGSRFRRRIRRPGGFRQFAGFRLGRRGIEPPAYGYGLSRRGRSGSVGLRTQARSRPRCFSGLASSSSVALKTRAEEPQGSTAHRGSAEAVA
jgi:hypothetical protein